MRYYYSADLLRARRACLDRVDLFRRHFGDGPVELTVENIKRAVEIGLEIEWVAERLWYMVPGNNEWGLAGQRLYCLRSSHRLNEAASYEEIHQILTRAAMAFEQLRSGEIKLSYACFRKSLAKFPMVEG